MPNVIDMMEDFYDEQPDPEDDRHKAIHVIQINGEPGGQARVHHYTNDDLDSGYPSNDASWEESWLFDEAVKRYHTVSGTLCDVTVYINNLPDSEWRDQQKRPMTYSIDDDLMITKKILNRLLVDPILFAFAGDDLKFKGGDREDHWGTWNLYRTIEAARAHLERACGDEPRPDDVQHLEVEVPYYLPTEETDWR